MDQKKRNTLVLIAVLIVILGAVVLIQVMSKEKKQTNEVVMVAVIQQEGKVLERIPLDQDREFVVQHPTSGFNAVRIKDGKICVTDADCADLTCVRTGNAWEEGQVIACLPHRLIIYVEQESSENK